ncbi:DUF1573 domain-containing protein [Zunongwangia sp. SCSIO 43204]|uniref:DUF1573 domain-containing protein n=1 Tax=Zunongwangia sp. SCSIO 43204 TaxID=2779359 RepID=UPI001CA8B87B|nr:DUF1573 domain-containing protein [Zunongwangia sp. SCSIO 43204]UAB84523.1 DUF1573 domain-containing protein [Zunongwangia sp. SCSIO 43204]
MKKLALIAILAFVGFNSAIAQKAAKMEFKSETLDYGEIKKGSDGVRVFEFTNTGDIDLVITNVTSSCGCTIPKKPDGPVKPGESGKIEVKYDTRRVGPIRKTVTVYSNAEEPTKALKIKGRVIDAEATKTDDGDTDTK